MTSPEIIDKTQSLITLYRFNTYIAQFLDYEVFKSEIEMTTPGTEATVRITNGEPSSSEDHYDEKATVSRNSQKEIGGISYFVDEMSVAPTGKNLIVTVEEFRLAEDVQPELPFLKERRTVALKDTDRPAKIVLKVYMHKGKEISVFDFASGGAEIENSPLSKQSFFTTDEEERLMKSLGMTR